MTTEAALRNGHDWAVHKSTSSHEPDIAHTTALELISYFQNSHALAEISCGFNVISHNWREIIDVDGHLPRGMRRELKNSDFTFTIDQQFQRVMEECAKPRGETPRWIGNKTMDMLMELYAAGYAHSFDSYKDGKLCGGNIGLSRNGMYISLSAYGHCPNAGNASLAPLKKTLFRRGFLFHDAISPSNISRNLGGYLIHRSEHHERQAEARKIYVSLPHIPDPLSVAAYIQPPTHG